MRKTGYLSILIDATKPYSENIVDFFENLGKIQIFSQAFHKLKCESLGNQLNSKRGLLSKSRSSGFSRRNRKLI
jgi:hypothetical protein